MGFGATPFGSLFGGGAEVGLEVAAPMPARIGMSAAIFAPPGQIGLASPLLADNIDPDTKDFRDLFVGMDPVDAAVQVAVTTMRNSGPSVRGVGVRLTNNKLTADFKRITAADYRLALSALTDRKDIEISSIAFGVDSAGTVLDVVNEGDASAQMLVKYINLRAFDSRVRSVPLGSTASRL